MILMLNTFSCPYKVLLERVLADHQPVMTAATEKGNTMRADTESVTTTNTISERDFAQPDRLLCEKSNATTLALKAHIIV